jgi:nucleoside-diphosphate-sugar epimerase
MKILITGATGYIGRNLASVLANDNNNHIFALIRETTDKNRLPKNTIPVTYKDINALINTFKQHDIEGIVHLAGYFTANHNPDDIDKLITANVTLGTNIIESGSRTKVKWFINTSSFWQYYMNMSYNPVALYAATKKAFEDILRYYAETSSIRIVNLELFDTYGPSDHRLKLFRHLMNAMESGHKLSMSPGEQLINLVYIDDVVSAYLLTIEALHKGHPQLAGNYSISSKNLFSLKEVVNIFSEECGNTIYINWGGIPYRPREVMNPRPQYPEVPGWCQKYDLKLGIQKLLKAHTKKSEDNNA